MNLHKKKMIAPIVITVIVILYFVLYFGFLIYLVPGIWNFLLGIIPLFFSGVMILAKAFKPEPALKG